MRIAHVCPSLSRAGGGVSLVVRRLAQELLALGNEEMVIARQDEFWEADIGGWEPVATRAFPAGRGRSLVAAARTWGALQRFGPDVVHRHALWRYHSVVTLAWRVQTNRPLVITPHGTLDAGALSISRWKKRLALALYEQTHLQRAACIHVYTTDEAAAVRQLGIRTPICVVSNGVDIPIGTPAAAPPWEEDGRRVMLFLGRIHPKKGIEQLIRGWAAAARGGRLRDWRLVIAGWDDGGYEKPWRALARQLCSGSIEFVGPVFGDTKAAALHQASAFVLPSVSEGQPIAVLEAWAHRLPSMISPGCNLSVGFERNAALRVEPTETSISHVLHDLTSLGDVQLRQLGERALATVRESFTWPLMARQMAEVYQWLLGGGARPSTMFD